MYGRVIDGDGDGGLVGGLQFPSSENVIVSQARLILCCLK